MRAGLVSLLSVCLAGAAGPAGAEVLVSIDKTSQRMTVAVDGSTRHVWPVSTGVAAHDTPGGSYRPFRMERTHFSREWDDAPMPYAVFFTGQGHAIHGTNHLRALGRPASHGCVRLSVRNAATLFTLVKAQGLGQTRVVIEGADLLVAGGDDEDAALGRRRALDPSYGILPGTDPFDRVPQRAVSRPVGPPAYAPALIGPVGADGIDGW